MIIKRSVSYSFLFFLFLIGIPGAFAQLIPSTTTEEKAPELTPDSLGRRTPRGTVNGFIDAMTKQNYVRASRYLNLNRSRRSDSERERIVKIFQQLLDQGGNIMPYSWVSNLPSGRTDDELPIGTDLAGNITVGAKTIDLLVENTRDDADPLWQFSAGTVDTVLDLTLTESSLINRVLPKVMQENKFSGVAVGQWVAVLLLIAFSYLVAWSLIAILQLITHLLWRKSRKEPTRGVVDAFALPIRLYLAVWCYVVLSQQVGLSIIVRQRFSGITVIVGLVALAILLWQLTDFISNFSKRKMTLRGRVSAISVMLFLRRAAKVAIVVFAAIAILGTLGFEVTTGLAALGIGGIALALGAQKTIENFVGSVTLITDQPVRVGDYCKVGTVAGTVEQIGMRSTRIRTQERTTVTIPNGQFSSDKIENFASRERFLFMPTLRVRLETTSDQIRFLLVELRSILYAHPMVLDDPARVRFTGFAETFLKIEIYAYIDTVSYDVFLEVQEDLYLRMMEVIRESGTDITSPAQTIYISKDKGLSEEKAAKTAEKVQSWKDTNDIQLPNFDPQRIAALKGSIKYPPEGSVKNKNIN